MPGELMSGSEVLFSYSKHPKRIEMRRRRNAMLESTAYEVWEDFAPVDTFLSPQEATRKFVTYVQDHVGPEEEL